MEFQEIDNYARAIERDILLAQHILKLGRNESIASIKALADELDKKHRHELMKELKQLAATSEDALTQIQQRIGEFSFENRWQDIHSGEDFDRLSAPIFEVLENARRTIEQVDFRTNQHLAEYTGELAAAWRNLHLHLEMIHLDILLSETVAEAERGKVREEVVAALKNAAKTTELGEAKARLEQPFKDHHNKAKTWSHSLATLLHWPDLFGEKKGD